MNFHNLRTLATRKTDGSRLTGSAAVGYNFLDGHPEVTLNLEFHRTAMTRS